MKYLVCQSCGLPFTEENCGCMRDATPTEDYCCNCYINGEFTDHSMTMHKLENILLDMAELHNEISLEEARHIIQILPNLKRWQMSNM
jgi:hypothetical protein